MWGRASALLTGGSASTLPFHERERVFRRDAADTPAGSSRGALAHESVVCTRSASTSYRSTSACGYSPSILSPVRCLIMTALATDFAAKWLFMYRYAFLTMARA